MSGRENTIRLAGGVIERYFHACAFFHGRDEEYPIVGPFVQEGLRQGEKAIHITEPSFGSEHLRRLQAVGVDLAEARKRRQFELLSWDEAYLKGGGFSVEGMLSLVERTLLACAADGFPRTRIVGHMDWALEDRPGVDGLLEYEARVNDVLARHKGPAVCVYDLTRCSASMVVDVLRTHPLVVLGGELRENPFFVPPDRFLRELRLRRQGVTS